MRSNLNHSFYKISFNLHHTTLSASHPTLLFHSSIPDQLITSLTNPSFLHVHHCRHQPCSPSPFSLFSFLLQSLPASRFIINSTNMAVALLHRIVSLSPPPSASPTSFHSRCPSTSTDVAFRRRVHL